jgi:hypothetical protein
MLKSLFAVVFTAFFTVSAFAAGPSQIWRLEVTSGEEGIVEITEIGLLDESDASVVDLIRTYTYEETAAIGSAAWSVSHNMSIQTKFSDVNVIAYDVDVVAPGTWYLITSTAVLNYRSHLSWDEVEYLTTDTPPASPELGDVYYSPSADLFYEYDGVWNVLTVTSGTSLPQPNMIEPTLVTKVPGVGGPAAGGPAANDVVDITFPEPVVGAATIMGSSFDNTAVNRPGEAIPPSELIPNRKGTVAFDGNTASWFKSSRAPTENNPLAIQYTYWVGDFNRFPTVSKYTISVRTTETAPRSWRLMYWEEGGWKKADQQAGIRFEDGETKTFDIE